MSTQSKGRVESGFVCSVMRIGEWVDIYLDKFKGDQLFASKLIAHLSIAEADDLVKELSAAVHELFPPAARREASHPQPAAPGDAVMKVNS